MILTEKFKSCKTLETRNDLISWLKEMLPDPFKFQDAIGSSYKSQIRELEYISRPLWAIFSLIASDEYDEKLVMPYIERIKLGLHPHTQWSFFKPTTKTRQIAVEMAVYGYGLLCCQEKLLKYFDEQEIKYLEEWLYSINEIEFPQNNWLLFLIIVNCGLKSNHLQYSQKKIDDAKDKINQLYVGNGWYQDGVESQRDYYIAFGFHFYSMLLSKFTDELDVHLVKTRCQAFQNDFQYWIDQQGRTIQFGRSLSYRFGHVAYWVGQVICECYTDNLAEIKEIIFRNLNFWHQHLIISNHMIPVGCGYENLLISEDYNAVGSPAWALKTFALLMLPSCHPFWKIKPQKKPIIKTISCQKKAGFLIVAGKNHHYALSGFQYSQAHILQHQSKYGKFCYSTAFGWNLSRDVQGIDNFAVDNALALSVSGTNQFSSRGEIQNYSMHEDYVYSQWNYGEIAEIESWLIPINEDYHLRIHRIHSTLNLETYEGAFPVLGWHYKFNMPIIKEHTIILENKNMVSGIYDLFKNREPVAVKQNPNTNIYDFETNGVACLYSKISKGTTIFGSLIYGNLSGICPDFITDIKFNKQTIILNDKKIYLEEF